MADSDCGCGGPSEEVLGGRSLRRRRGGRAPRGHNKPRPSPTSSATLFAVGTRRKGGDGNMWCVGQTTGGVQRWKRVAKTPKNGAGAAPKKTAGATKKKKSAAVPRKKSAGSLKKAGVRKKTGVGKKSSRKKITIGTKWGRPLKK